MPTKPRARAKVSVNGIGWKRSLAISAEKFALVARAITSALTTEPIRFSELSRRVARKLPNFEGSVSWYTVSVARELELRGKLVRQTKPVLYSKPRRSSANGIAATPLGKKKTSRSVKASSAA